jgi:hypothetical protein
MPFIKFKKVWEDDDSMLKIELSASNESLTTTQDFYIYPEDFRVFAQEMESFFPKLGKGEVVLEYGSETESYYAYVLLKVTYKNLGELNIEVRTNNKQESNELAISHFFTSITNQELSNLGKSLVNWSNDMKNEFVYEWQGA